MSAGPELISEEPEDDFSLPPLEMEDDSDALPPLDNELEEAAPDESEEDSDDETLDSDYSGEVYEDSFDADAEDLDEDDAGDEPDYDEEEDSNEPDDAEDSFASDEALRAAMRAREASGGDLPSNYSSPRPPTLAEQFDLDFVLGQAILKGASDVHISPNNQVAFSILGEIARQPQFGMLTGDLTQSLHYEILTNVLESNFVEELELDTSYVIHDGENAGRRFRLSVGKTFGDVYMVFRVISDDIPTLDDLGVTDSLKEWSKLPNGLVMMNGPTGTGKALALSTRIPTPEGDKKMGELHRGSTVYDSQMNEVQVTGVSPIDYKPELFELTTASGKTALADANHQWIVSTSETRRFASAGDLDALVASGAKLSQAASELEDAHVPDFGSIADVYQFAHDNGGAKYFPTLDSVRRCLRFMDTPHDEGSYELYRAITDLAARLRQRVDYGPHSPFRVLTTAELIEQGILDSSGEPIFEIPTVFYKDAATQHDPIVAITPVSETDPRYEPVRCISVNSEDRSYLCGDYLVTHNSTTLAALLNTAIHERAQKIITIERPIEYVFGNDHRGFVTQREVGQDSRGFDKALDSAMRQAPDIIMIGESRNREEIDQVLRAAETGHLTMTTMHTNSAAATINRIKSLFSGSEQQRVLATLADVSRGYANQVLVKSLDGTGRFAVRELLEFTDEVAPLVAAGDIPGIRRYQTENHLTMEDGLVKAVVDGRCSLEDARAQSAYPRDFDKLMKSFG